MSGLDEKGLIPTGIAGLDEILLGGVRKNNIILVEGAPGTGKTTLGLEFIYRGALEFDQPGVVVSFELSPQKLLRDAAGFGWDYQTLERQGKVSLIYTTPSVILDDLQSPDGVLASEIKRLGAKRILIDGLTPLRLFGERLNGRPFRDSLHLLVESLQRAGVTAMLTSEIPRSPLEASENPGHERFVCDTIVTLTATTQRRSLHRTLEVVKSRGQDFISGIHTLRIQASQGVEVYRRTQSRPKHFQDQPSSTKRISSGNPGLDEMLGGGLYEGSVTLTVGISGTGKTVAGVQFLLEGARKGEKGLLITLDEHPEQLMRNAGSLGLDLRDAVDRKEVLIHYDSPLEVELDVHFDQIVRMVKQHDIKRVVLDSLAAYESASPTESMDFVYALATYLKNRLVTTVCNYESPELLGITQISEELKVSHLVDNIILLNYVEISTQLRRAITVPKVRGSRNLQRTREFTIDQGGIALLNEQAGQVPSVPQLPFSSYYGLLARSPARKSPLIEEAVLTGGELPPSTPPDPS